MRTPREPFFGLPEDRHILGESAREFVELGSPLAELFPEASAGVEESSIPALVEHEMKHPDATGEKGTELALGFMPHDGENRTTRRAAVATWQPPKQDQPKKRAVGAGEAEPGAMSGADASPATPAMPTRRELWLQRQRQRRGKLDPELRRIQRRKAAR